MKNIKRQSGYSLVEIALTGLILILLLTGIKMIAGSHGGNLSKGTKFTVSGHWTRTPATIGSDAHGKLSYGLSVSGRDASGIKIRYRIRGSDHVLIMSHLRNEQTTYDDSVQPIVPIMQGEITTNTSGEAVLEMAALSRGTIEVSAQIIDPAGGIHMDSSVQRIAVDNGQEASTSYH